MSHAISLREKRVFLTGVGDERGLGFQFAQALIKEGAEVFVTDINPNVHELGKRLGARSYVADLTKSHEVDGAVAEAVRVMGDIDIVIANAGMANSTTFENDPDRYLRVREVNEVGVYNTIRATKPYLKAPGKYVLVNASNGGIVPLFLMGAYNASKAHAIKLGEWANLELIGTGARGGVLLLSEHTSPMEDNFKTSLPRLLMKHNYLLRKGHKERKPHHAVEGMLRAVKGRRLYTHAPRHTVLARYFPAIIAWVTRQMHQDIQPVVDMSREEWDSVRGPEVD